MEFNRWRVLTTKDVTGILRRGGTISAPSTPAIRSCADHHARRRASSTPTGSSRCSTGWDSTRLVVIGGDGTLAIAHEFNKLGIPIVGVPKTIDNDIVGTTNCFGFDTAVTFATDAIDRLHTTAEAHRRVMVVEVMGRYAGWIALYAGVGGGADVILIPEIPVRPRQGRRSEYTRATRAAPNSASLSWPRARGRKTATCRSSKRPPSARQSDWAARANSSPRGSSA